MDEQNTPQNVFEKIRLIRENHLLDLKDIAQKSRIQLQYLEAIESGNLEAIPDVYDKLFFQTYLTFLPLTEDEKKEILKEFQIERQKIKPEKSTTIRNLKAVELDESDIKRYKNLFIALPILLVIVIIGFLAFNSESTKVKPEAPIEEISIYEVVHEVTKKDSLLADSTEKAAEKKQPLAGKGKVNVELNAAERTWLRVVADHADTSEYLLKKDEKLSLGADSTLEFLVGKANGISFTVNGEQIGILGQPGQVISYLKATEKGIVNKRIKTIQKKETSSDTLRTR